MLSKPVLFSASERIQLLDSEATHQIIALSLQKGDALKKHTVSDLVYLICLQGNPSIQLFEGTQDAPQNTIKLQPNEMLRAERNQPHTVIAEGNNILLLLVRIRENSVSAAADAAGGKSATSALSDNQTAELPETLKGVAVVEGKTIVLDVRDMLRRNEEPFQVIMQTIEFLPEDFDLKLHATFEPVPLFKVLGKQGFDHEAIQHAQDHWEVVFKRWERE